MPERPGEQGTPRVGGWRAAETSGMDDRTDEEPAQGSADLRAETGAKGRDVSGCGQQGSHPPLPIVQDTEYLSVPVNGTLL